MRSFHLPDVKDRNGLQIQTGLVIGSHDSHNSVTASQNVAAVKGPDTDHDPNVAAADNPVTEHTSRGAASGYRR